MKSRHTNVVFTKKTVLRSPLHYLVNRRGAPALIPARLYPALLRHLAHPQEYLPLSRLDVTGLCLAFSAADQELGPRLFRKNARGQEYKLNGLLDCEILIDQELVRSAEGIAPPAVLERLKIHPRLDPLSFTDLETKVLHLKVQEVMNTRLWASGVSQHPACLQILEEIAVLVARQAHRKDDKDHLFNDAWLRLTIRFGEGRGFSFDIRKGTLEPWFRQVVRRACRESLREEWRKPRPCPLPDLANLVDRKTNEPGHWLKVLQKGELLEAVYRLPEEQQVIVTMIRHEYSLADIARRLGESKPWVQRRWEKARTELRRLLG